MNLQKSSLYIMIFILFAFIAIQAWLISVGRSNFFSMIFPEVQMFTGKTVKVEYFSMAGCPHCVKFNPEWESFVEQAATMKGAVETKKFDAREDSADVQKAGVDSFPTVLISKNGKATPYEGPRSAKALVAEVAKLM